MSMLYMQECLGLKKMPRENIVMDVHEIWKFLMNSTCTKIFPLN